MFSKRLKSLRTKKGLSQQYMADYIGISRQGYGKYEDGQSEPDHNTLIKLAQYFDVPTDYLLGITDNPNYEPTNDDDQFEYYKNKIITEFPDIDLMFKDLANLSGEGLKEVYEFIKFKSQQEKEK